MRKQGSVLVNRGGLHGSTGVHIRHRTRVLLGQLPVELVVFEQWVKDMRASSASLSERAAICSASLTTPRGW